MVDIPIVYGFIQHRNIGHGAINTATVAISAMEDI